MKILDLFSGLGGWSAAFAERGHDVTTMDIDPRFNPTICHDILSVSPAALDDDWDIILASPPCECFSVASIGKYWYPDKAPRNDKAVSALAIVSRTVNLINALKKRAFIIENPRGMMRTLSFMWGFERRTVTYCQYGETRMKPTDLWGGFPSNLVLKPPCKNGDPCHVRASRGARTGTQGIKGADKRAMVPYKLSLDVCLAMETA